MNNPLSIFAVLNENRYSIPLYQRNFAWTDVEISQLIIDVLDSIKENRPEYFIGTLVVSNKDNMYSIIDGQQRFTAILLIALAIQNEYVLPKIYVKNINLSFSARRRSDETLNNLFKNDISRLLQLLNRKIPINRVIYAFMGIFLFFWYVDMHACVCLFSRRGEYLLTQAHPECR